MLESAPAQWEAVRFSWLCHGVRTHASTAGCTVIYDGAPAPASRRNWVHCGIRIQHSWLRHCMPRRASTAGCGLMSERGAARLDLCGLRYVRVDHDVLDSSFAGRVFGVPAWFQPQGLKHSGMRRYSQHGSTHCGIQADCGCGSSAGAGHLRARLVVVSKRNSIMRAIRSRNHQKERGRPGCLGLRPLGSVPACDAYRLRLDRVSRFAEPRIDRYWWRCGH